MTKDDKEKLTGWNSDNCMSLNLRPSAVSFILVRTIALEREREKSKIKYQYNMVDNLWSRCPHLCV